MAINTKEVGKHVSRWKNRAWRLKNLYLIQNEVKEIRPFEPREEQERFLRERHDRNFVPKSRKYGISTVIVLDYLDACIWANPGQAVHAAHVDFRDDDAKAKLDIARFAWEQGLQHPDPYIRAIWVALHQRNPLLTDNAGELAWLNGSKQQASTSFMGGTPTRLHISEFGPLSAQFPDRAAKVARGTINAVPRGGVIDIETTMEGGTFGECAAIFKLAEESVGRALSFLDWKLFFIPWYKHPSYLIAGAKPERRETYEYFTKLTLPRGDRINLEQMAWYEGKKREQRNNMFTQFPTVESECWYAGAGAAFFDTEGLLWQQQKAVPLEIDIRYGDVVVQGDVKDTQRRSANWVQRDKGNAPFRIIEHPMPGRRYVLFADCCIGKLPNANQSERHSATNDEKRDTHSYGVLKETYIDPSNGQAELPQIVCMCRGDDPRDPQDRSGDRSPTSEFIRRVVAMSIYYGDCLVIPEVNGKDDIAPRLMAAGVRNIWCEGIMGADGAMPGLGKSEKVFGFHTNEATRRQILDNMEQMTREQKWICSFLDVVHQMNCFVRNKKGRPEAAPGEHDDSVLGPALGLFALPHATVFKGREAVIQERYRNDWAEENWDARGL